MKKEIPKPLVIGIVVAVAAGAIFAVASLTSGPPEFKAPDTGKVIPNYVWDGLPPAQKAEFERQGYKPGDVEAKPNVPSGLPGAPASGK